MEKIVTALQIQPGELFLHSQGLNETEAASLHYSYIGGVERGDRNISLETLEKIIAAFRIPAEEIFRFEDHTDRRKAIDEHMTLISGRSTHEIEALTRINREVVATLDSSEKKMPDE